MNTTGLVTTVADELLAELEAGINSMTMRTAYVSLIVAEIGRLRAENAELAKDAGRYRWLRDEALKIAGWAPAAVITDGSMTQQFLEGRDLDDEIDTAMASQ